MIDLLKKFNINSPNKINFLISSIRYGAVLLFSLLFGVSGSDDFITKYDKYNSVCRKMGYQDKRCEETGRVKVILVTQTLCKRNEIKFLIFKLNIYVISFCVKKTK